MKKPDPIAKGIYSFANIPIEAFSRFVCSGCGGEDISMWQKEGLAHWATETVVCGHYRRVGPAVVDIEGPNRRHSTASARSHGTKRKRRPPQ